MRKWRLLVAAALGIGCALPAGLALADTSAVATIGGFNMLANAPGMQITYDNTAGVGGTHPVGYGTVPESTATLETGPIGKGLSSVVWPGPLLGNLGASTAVLPHGSDLPPPVITLLQQNGNDPIKAEATTGGPPDATYGDPGGAAVMTAHADANKTAASATTKGFEAPGAGTVGTITSTGTAILSTDTVVAHGESAASDINLGGGLVTIESVTSTATATSDGNGSKGEGTTTVTGLMVAGTPATVDENGLHIGSASQPLGEPVNDGLNTALAQSGLKITLTAPQEEKEGTAESFRAGSLVIKWEVPNDANGDSFEVTFGGAIAQVNANTASPDASAAADETTFGSSDSVAPSTTAPASTGTTAAIGASAAPETPTTAAPALKPLPATAVRNGKTQVALNSQPIRYSGGIKPGVVLLGLVGVALAAFGLRRLSSNVLAATPHSTTCPLERTKGDHVE